MHAQHQASAQKQKEVDERCDQVIAFCWPERDSLQGAHGILDNQITPCDQRILSVSMIVKQPIPYRRK